MPETTAGPVYLNATWSLQYMQDGSNPGELTIQATLGTTQLGHGDWIEFVDLPAGWTLATPSSSWLAQGNKLTWQETTSLPITDSGVTVPVTIGVAAGSGTNLVSIQLFDSGGASCSARKGVQFTVSVPGQPVVAFPTGSAAAIVTGTGSVPFPNSLGCCVMALAPPAQDVTVEFTIWWRDSSNTEQQLYLPTLSVTTSTQVTFTSDSAGGTWTASSISNLDTMQVTLANLVLLQASLPSLEYLEVRFKITVGSATPYDASAWFEGIGPYGISISMDEASSSATSYKLSGDSSSGYTVQFVVEGLNSPPLIPQLTEAGGDVAYPPIFGEWSLASSQIVSPANFTPGPNTLYWLKVEEGGAVVGAVSSCTVTLQQVTSATPGPLDLSGMNLPTVNMQGWQNLSGAQLGGATLTAANLSGANLSGANLTNAVLDNANLGNANLQKASLNQASLNGANLTGADLQGASLNQVSAAAAVVTGITVDSSTDLNLSSVNGLVSGQVSGTPGQLGSSMVLVNGFLIGTGGINNLTSAAGMCCSGVNWVNMWPQSALTLIVGSYSALTFNSSSSFNDVDLSSALCLVDTSNSFIYVEQASYNGAPAVLFLALPSGDPPLWAVLGSPLAQLPSDALELFARTGEYEWRVQGAGANALAVALGARR